MKANLIICSLLFTCFSASFAQNTYIYFPRQENSATTNAKMENSKIFLDKAYEAFNEGDLEKTRYYLLQSEKDGYVNASFYFLLGHWAYKTKNLTAARRYWIRGYQKRGCWECKEIADELVPAGSVY